MTKLPYLPVATLTRDVSPRPCRSALQGYMLNPTPADVPPSRFKGLDREWNKGGAIVTANLKSRGLGMEGRGLWV